MQANGNNGGNNGNNGVNNGNNDNGNGGDDIVMTGEVKCVPYQVEALMVGGDDDAVDEL